VCWLINTFILYVVHETFTGILDPSNFFLSNCSQGKTIYEFFYFLLIFK
jgi:hypothetical protein